MATLEFILLASLAVLISSVLEQVIPKLSSPLIQIGLGMLIALFAFSPIELDLAPELFLLIFVAPLLFQDAKHADKTALWRHRSRILSLAIGLVIAIMLIVGFTLNWLVPSIPLAAAFALGAALGPTDAVAVLSLKKEVSISRRENAWLSGEALINDASGVVAFQFAIAAAVTGSYTVIAAGIDFLILFFGGIVLGVICALVLVFIQNRIRNTGLESTTFFVLLDVLTPFMIYLLAEALHVSGIIAVVAAGLLIGNLSDRRMGPMAARLNIVSSSVWSVLLFTLNGIVFVMLGMELPQSFMTSWQDPGLNNALLITLVFVITFVIILARFLWISAVLFFSRDRTGNRAPFTKDTLRSALVMTMAGPKGAVTLSIMFSLPFFMMDGSLFPQRDFLIFFASGVILLTLLIANFTLPILAPAPKENSEDLEFERAQDVRIHILRQTITDLNAHRTSANAAATRAVIRSYQGRIARIQEGEDDEDEDSLELMRDVLHHQEACLNQLEAAGEVDSVAAYRYRGRLARREELLTRKRGLVWWIRNMIRHIRTTVTILGRLAQEYLPGVDETRRAAKLREVEILVEKDTVDYLESLIEDPNSPYTPDRVISLLSRHNAALITAQNSRPSFSRMIRTTDNIESVTRYGLMSELQYIQDAYDEGEISLSLARRLRENVYLMQMDLGDRIQ